MIFLALSLAFIFGIIVGFMLMMKVHRASHPECGAFRGESLRFVVPGEVVSCEPEELRIRLTDGQELRLKSPQSCTMPENLVVGDQFATRIYLDGVQAP